MSRRQIKFGFFLEGPGRTFADWRHPLADPGATYNWPFFKRQARAAERGLFDFLFIADLVYTNTKATPYHQSRFEPITIMAALAGVTEHIGLVCTVSSTYTEPYNLARYFASIDHISGGRSGWNVVTSYADGSALNFNQDRLPDHELRYKMAEEHLNVVQGLWDTWEDDTMVHDKAANVFLDADKLHELNFKGEFYQVKGPLNICRSPQGQPVIFQAGASDTGRTFAARYGEALFVAPFSHAEALAMTKDIKARGVALGRNPDHINVIMSTTPFIGRTKAEAEAKYQERADLLDLKDGMTHLSKFFDYKVDFSQYDPDGPFPADMARANFNGYQTALQRLIDWSEEGLTLRQIAKRYSTPKATFVGSYGEVADQLQFFFESGACDGFMVADGIPNSNEEFVDHVIPILQERGIYRTAYEGTTLRENLGLPRPVNRFAAARMQFQQKAG